MLHCRVFPKILPVLSHCRLDVILLPGLLRLNSWLGDGVGPIQELIQVDVLSLVRVEMGVESLDEMGSIVARLSHHLFDQIGASLGTGVRLGDIDKLHQRARGSGLAGQRQPSVLKIRTQLGENLASESRPHWGADMILSNAFVGSFS